MLLDTSVQNCHGDIREPKPTLLFGVPAVCESIRKGIIGRVNAGNLVLRAFFWGAMAAKTALLWTGFPGTSFTDTVAFAKVRETMSGRLRLCLNAGGLISKDTQRFISMAMVPMIIGYGLTETCGMGASMDPSEWTDESLGTIPASVEVKLVDFPSAGYFATNSQSQGEIWIRGAPVTTGCFENEKETQEAINPDG